jgi:DNA-binding HxlR family transcriptional regulator
MSDVVYDVMNPKCPTQQVLDLVASKWTMLVILALGDGPVRYSALQRRVSGVTKKMLTQTLRALERDGLVRREVYDSVPVQTEYELTPTGRSLAAAVAVIRTWAYNHVENIGQSRRAFAATSSVSAGERSARDTAPSATRSAGRA